MKSKGFGTLAKKIIAAIFFATAISSVAVGCAGKEKGLAGVTVRSAEEFLDALKNKEAVVYAEDLTFAEDTKIQLNYDLTIVGSGGKSTFRNVCFDVVGPNTAGEKISVAIENVVFDGGYRGALPEEGDK
ncbi:MAG: hypothetical protein J6U35_00815, partial [Clostridia bacterium]|nr:hypothetical protein [Clostridia bacterium]